VWLAPAAASHRKTAYDLRLVDLEGTLVSVDARLPGPLLAEALEAGEIPGFRPLSVQHEVSFGSSRLDLRLQTPEGAHWVEAKSVTLVCSGTALFPDAPTARGRRHLEELIRAVSGGEGGSVFFVVQRPDARRFAPHPEADPSFADPLRSARHAGVAVRAFTCRVSLREVRLGSEITVDLG
jgi:sugar fermentation stimulation protein A